MQGDQGVRRQVGGKKQEARGTQSLVHALAHLDSQVFGTAFTEAVAGDGSDDGLGRGHGGAPVRLHPYCTFRRRWGPPCFEA
jgi:hypothetical protein